MSVAGGVLPQDTKGRRRYHPEKGCESHVFGA